VIAAGRSLDVRSGESVASLSSCRGGAKAPSGGHRARINAD
jgi:hypothetical protein